MPRIPSLTIMDSCLVQPTRDDSGKQVEGSNWDGFQSGWGDAPNVWNDSTTDIPGSIINSIWLWIVQNSDWLTQLNLTILDNTQQPTATYPSSITEATEVTDRICMLYHWYLASIPSHLSLSETLRMYFETYGDPSDFTRSTIISLRTHQSDSFIAGETDSGTCRSDASESGEVWCSIQNVGFIQSELTSCDSYMEVNSQYWR